MQVGIEKYYSVRVGKWKMGKNWILTLPNCAMQHELVESFKRPDSGLLLSLLKRADITS